MRYTMKDGTEEQLAGGAPATMPSTTTRPGLRVIRRPMDSEERRALRQLMATVQAMQHGDLVLAVLELGPLFELVGEMRACVDRRVRNGLAPIFPLYRRIRQQALRLKVQLAGMVAARGGRS